LISGFTLLHGEAVAIGLVIECLLGEQIGMTRSGTAAELALALGGAGLPTALPPGTGAERLAGAMRTDKKGREGEVAFAFLAEPGRVSAGRDGHWVTRLAHPELLAALHDVMTEGAEHQARIGGLGS
jgi:3-dehydroquinate synthase